MHKNYKLALLLFISCGLFITACQDEPSPEATQTAATFKHTTISKWNDVFLHIERHAAGYRPGPAPRALGLIGLATYEACINGMPEYQSLATQYQGLSIPAADPKTDYYWPAVASGVHEFLLRRFFATQDDTYLAEIDKVASELEFAFKSETTSERVEASKAYGANVGDAIWQWSKTDPFGHDAFLDPFNNYAWQDHYAKDGDWAPTLPGPGRPMFPYWGKARTFAIEETDKLCEKPIPYSASPTSELYAQALEVYARSGVNQTYEDKWIGEFWSDDILNLTFSPGPRWIAVANQVYTSKDSDLETAIVCNAKTGMALNDAAVACWHSKYYYNVERPETYIKRVIDPNYEPALKDPQTGATGITPSFPAFPSGHSTMGAAGAEILTSIFGNNYAMFDKCHNGRSEFLSTPRFFGSFYDMAEENAISRVPLGVHFRMDCEVGVDLGLVCGRKVNALPWKK
jgi:PAP2 superfamily